MEITALIDIKLGIKSTKKQPEIQLCNEYCNQNLAHHQYGNNFINLQVFLNFSDQLPQPY